MEGFGALPPARVIHILVQACASLEEAHSAGLIHRDIKPANLVLTRRGGVPDVVKVLDFGLVKDQGAGAIGVTAVDSVIGTPQFMAPESIRAPKTVTGAVDLYALGCVGYFLLTGFPPFGAKTITALCAAHLELEPERPGAVTGEHLPSDLEAVILCCLAKRPEERFESAGALKRALAECTDANSWSRQDAEDWWAAHPPDRSAATKSGAKESKVEIFEEDMGQGSSEDTIAIDLDRRSFFQPCWPLAT